MLFGTFSFPESLVCAKLRDTRLNNSGTDMQYILYMSFPFYVLVPPQKVHGKCGSNTVALPTRSLVFQRGIAGVTGYQVAWKDPRGVAGRRRRHGSPSSLCSVPTTRFQTEQARRLDFHRRALVTNLACCGPPAISPARISLLSLPLVLPLLPPLLPICLIFTVSAQPLPSDCFLRVPFIFFWSCQFSRLPHSLERRARVSPGYSASGTFQLACIPASGCVTDKMEQIPPGHCYLCFPAVTHKQAYTFPHVHGHMSLHAREMPGRQLPVLQMHRTDSSPTRGGQAL